MRMISMISAATAVALTGAAAFAQMAPPATETPSAVQSGAPAPSGSAERPMTVRPANPASPYDGAALPQAATPTVDRSAELMIGKPLRDTLGDKVGTVADVVRDSTGHVTEIHADVGGVLGILTTRVSIPAGQVSIDDEGMRVSLSKEQIESQPKVEG